MEVDINKLSNIKSAKAFKEIVDISVGWMIDLAAENFDEISKFLCLNGTVNNEYVSKMIQEELNRSIRYAIDSAKYDTDAKIAIYVTEDNIDVYRSIGLRNISPGNVYFITLFVSNLIIRSKNDPIDYRMDISIESSVELNSYNMNDFYSKYIDKKEFKILSRQGNVDVDLSDINISILLIAETLTVLSKATVYYYKSYIGPVTVNYSEIGSSFDSITFRSIVAMNGIKPQLYSGVATGLYQNSEGDIYETFTSSYIIGRMNSYDEDYRITKNIVFLNNKIVTD